MKIGFVGDPHTGRMRALLGNERGDAAHARLWLRQIEWVREAGCSHAVIVGDVFDTPFPDQEQLLLVVNALAAASDLRFLCFAGNHDVHDAATNSLRLLRRMPEVGALRHVTFVADAGVVDWEDARLLVIPWGSKRERDPREHVIASRPHLTVFHDSVVGAKRDNGTAVPVGQGVAAASLGGSRVAVGGHLHTPQRVGDVYYCGTGAQLSFGESAGKRLLTIDVDGKSVKVASRRVDPPWVLETARWSSSDPPGCDAPGTYYRLVIGEEAPPPRWLVEHPRVVRTAGASVKKLRDVASGVVNLMSGGKVGGSDDAQLLQRYLHQHTNLDALLRAQAMKIHGRMLKGD